MRATQQRSEGGPPLNRHLPLLPLAAALLVFLSPAVAPAQETTEREAPVMRKITVQGTYLLSHRAVLDMLGLKEGARLDREGLKQSIARVNGAATIGKVTAEVADVEPGAVEVRVGVTERIGVTRVEFKGNNKVSSDRLATIIAIQPPAAVDPVAVKRVQEELGRVYAGMGHPLASVQAYVRIEDGDRTLVFDIVEGPQAWVEDIVVEGNSAFSADELLDEMKSRKRGWPGFVWPGRFDEPQFREDILRLKDKYYRAGYLDADVGGYWSHGDELDCITLHVLVYEGSRYKVEGVSFEGNTVFRADELLRAMPLKVGQPYLPDDLERSRKIISEMYGRQGYVDVGALNKDTLRDQLIVHEEQPLVRVQFSIVEGQPVFVRRVRVEGLTKTDELVVIRNLTFYPGERVNTDTLRESERVLEGTGYFDLSQPKPVDIFLEPDEGAMRDAVVRVKEGMTGMFTVGLAVSTDAGLMGQVAYEERNFDISNWPQSWDDLWHGNALRGGGQDLKVRLALGSEQSSFLISFFDPAVHHSVYSFGAKLYSTIASWEEFDLRRTGAAVRFGKRLSRHVTRGLEFGLESISMSNVDEDAPPEILRDKGSFFKPFGAFFYEVDKRDSKIWPSQGYTAEARAELGLVDVSTITLTGQAEKYWTIGEGSRGKHVLKLRGMAGVMESYSGRIPVFERFYAGGQSSLRGFGFRGVSPVQAGEQIGGKSMLVGSLEYLMPTGEKNLKLAFFMDSGWVSESSGNVLTGSGDLRVSLGAGVRWLIPALGNVPLVVDVAVPIIMQEDDETQAISFSLGTMHTF